MPVSNSVIRRYTPPTCTLEILAQSSALSQWTGKSVLKQLEFELRFDDPRLPEEKRIAIKGDSDQLEALCAVVTNYVQEFLQMSPDSFWANFSRTHDATFISDEAEQRNFNNPSLLETQAINSFTQRPVADIHIKPSTHLTHNLFLGSLANPASGHVIQLSLLQLFDLATALDEYSADVMALPNLTPRSTRSRIPTWAPVAAVLVVAVGLAPLTWQYANQNRQKQTAKKPTAQEKIALESSPSQNPSISTLPTLAPPDSLPSQSLPPLGSPLQVPNSTASPPAIAQTLPSVPATPQIPQTGAKSALPSASQTSPSLGNVPTAPLPSLGTTLNIPGTPKAPTLSTSPQNAAPKPQIAIQSQPPLSSTPLTANRGTSASAPKNSTPSDLPSTGIGSDTSTASPPLASLTNPSGGATREPSFSQPGTSEPSGTDALITRLREARRNRGNLPTEVATTSSGTATNSDTLFDTAQVAQAREKLKKGWQPPSGLSQSIEYSLIVAVDGSIEQILPLGKAARDYVDRTGMPLIGEPFVSPNKNGQSVKIRAVFSPDGKVQTFPEKE
ncbi:DUF4335 domain-containing protein [Tolypothrix campylonemoides VB511288]|nr:DUF4335 domain-containing protein [Tolypothrix campylonemoides VB511288]